MAKLTRSSGEKSRRSNCPLACSLDVLGDRWTLLVVRDLFDGKARYGEFLRSAEGIPTNVLADRLQRLEVAGLVKSSPYQENPPRYEYSLTPKGKDLKPVLAALAMWSMRHQTGTKANENLVGALKP